MGSTGFLNFSARFAEVLNWCSVWCSMLGLVLSIGIDEGCIVYTEETVDLVFSSEGAVDLYLMCTD